MPRALPAVPKKRRRSVQSAVSSSPVSETCKRRFRAHSLHPRIFEPPDVHLRAGGGGGREQGGRALERWNTATIRPKQRATCLVPQLHPTVHPPHNSTWLIGRFLFLMINTLTLHSDVEDHGESSGDQARVRVRVPNFWLPDRKLESTTT